MSYCFLVKQFADTQIQSATGASGFLVIMVLLLNTSAMELWHLAFICVLHNVSLYIKVLATFPRKLIRLEGREGTYRSDDRLTKEGQTAS